MLFVDMSYCAICDKYFPTAGARAQHVQMSKNHPECTSCHRRFSNKNALRTHYAFSSRHHYCSVCEIDFHTAAGLRVHVEHASVHRDDSDDDDECDECELVDLPEGWEDEYGSHAYPEENAAAAAALEAEEAAEARGSPDETAAEEYWDEDEFRPEEFTDAELAAGVSQLRGDATSPMASRFDLDAKLCFDAEEAIEELEKYFEVAKAGERRASV